MLPMIQRREVTSEQPSDWAKTKSGNDRCSMMEHQDFETHLNCNSVFTGSLKSMLEMTSVGNSVKAVLSPLAFSWVLRCFYIGAYKSKRYELITYFIPVHSIVSRNLHSSEITKKNSFYKRRPGKKCQSGAKLQVRFAICCIYFDRIKHRPCRWNLSPKQRNRKKLVGTRTRKDDPFRLITSLGNTSRKVLLSSVSCWIGE